MPGPVLNPAVEAVSVFFPCFNDEGTIADMVSVAMATIDRLGVDGEVIVINDGSRDRTLQRLQNTRSRRHVLPPVHPHSVSSSGQEQENSRRFAAEELRKSEPRTAPVRGPQERIESVPLQHDDRRDPAHPINECDSGFGRGQHGFGGVLSV